MMLDDPRQEPNNNSESNNHLEMEAKVVSGIGWSYAERLLAQLVSFIVSVVLARLLLPEEYGVITIILVFINIANVLVSNGLGEALIQRDELILDEYSTVFWMSLGLSSCLYIVLFICAPIISKFYSMPILIPTIRVLSLKLLLAAFNTVQQAYVAKKMIFKKFFWATFWGTVISAMVGIILAFKGFGVWALVAQYLTNSLIDTIILQNSINWNIKPVFHLQAARQLIKYGWKLTASALITELYNELRTIVIGKVYTAADLAFYNRGNHFPNLLISNLNGSMAKVFFPSMVSLNKDYNELRDFTRRALKISCYIVFPILIGLISVGDNLISVLLTVKWNGCIPYLRILSIFWLFQPVQTADWQVLKAVGRSDLCLKLEIAKKIIGVVLIITTVFISVNAIAWSAVAFAIISAMINTFYCSKIIQYSVFDHLEDMFPFALCSTVMGACVFTVNLLGTHKIVTLLLQVIVGIIVYFGLMLLSRNGTQKEFFSLLKSFVKRK